MTPKKLKLLRAIRNCEKHTLANAVLAPLCASGIIECEYKPNGTAKSAKLTAWGVTTLAFEEKQISDRYDSHDRA